MMSEIKGQLLGILLVVLIFGGVSTALVSIFNSLTTKVEEKVNEEISSLDSKSMMNKDLLHY